MTAWEYLLSKSPLSSATAWEHWQAMRGFIEVLSLGQTITTMELPGSVEHEDLALILNTTDLQGNILQNDLEGDIISSVLNGSIYV